ncbi:MAG: hypothetical protein QNJ42_19120 [Crocosphaera sp.]|nr:hypothetical protein [Crocosphaera sp.]
MASSLLISSLRSRRIRSRVLGVNLTQRVIGQPLAQNEGGGFLETAKSFLGIVGRGTLKVGGWLFKGLGFVGFGFRAILDVFWQSFDYIWNFNWNVTDAELDRGIANLKVRIAGQLGATAGNLVGYIACGVIPSIGILVINEPLGLYLLQQVGEEALDEFLSNIRILLRTSLYGLVQSAWITMFKNTRRAAKIATKDPDAPISRLGKRIFGEGFQQAIQQWGEEGSKPWSFAIEKERRRDEIKNPLAKEFWEEFDDEFADACRDASYVIADGLDSWALQQRMEEETRGGNQVAIEFLPNRELEDERMIVSGSEQEVRTQLITTMNTYEMIEHRDVGMYMGEQVRTHVRKRVPPLTLRVQLFNWPSPPFYRSDSDTRRVSCDVPGIKRNKLDWNTIKEAFGGNTGYLWGRFYTVVNLKDSDGHFAGQLKIYGGSKSEAERRIDRVLQLTEYEELTRTHGEEDESRTDNNNGKKYKASTRIYPAYMTIINAKKVAREELGQPSLQGTYKRSRDKILLYPNDKPANFEERINELLSNLPQ